MTFWSKLEEFKCDGTLLLPRYFDTVLTSNAYFATMICSLLEPEDQDAVLYYLVRLGRTYRITKNSQILILMVAVLAHKYWQDDCYGNVTFVEWFFATRDRNALVEFHGLEIEALRLLEYDLSIKTC